MRRGHHLQALAAEALGECLGNFWKQRVPVSGAYRRQQRLRRPRPTLT
jgi:hypothetical protein